MERNIIGDLLIFKTMGMKPNFSELERIYGIERHTISKYWKQGGKKMRNPTRKASLLDEYKDEITKTLKKPGVNVKAAYELLYDKYGNDIGSYNNLRYYVWKNGLKPPKYNRPHVRYETLPGKQLQIDWKEDIHLKTKSGKQITFNILTSTLSYSRQHIFIYSKSRTTEDFLRSTIDTLNKLGGIPEHILTDNMAAVLSVTNGSKQKHKKILQFESDIGIRIRLCKARTPETKGKDESANRFLSWLYAYDGEFEDEDELITIIEHINNKVNNQINQTTNLPPISLFQKEKEYLKPLPNKVLLDNYIDIGLSQVVPSTLLVTYKGSGYSIPSKYMNKRIKLYPIDHKLYVYFNTELITVHELSNNRFNYKNNHYVEALTYSIKNDDLDIEQIAKENLELLERIKK